MNITATFRDSALLQRPRSWVAHMTDRTAVSLDNVMASTTTAATSTPPTHKRIDSKNLKEDPPPRSCCACTGSEGPFIRPCRFCNADYCVDCLHSMFTSAVKDATRMPPKCCHFFQIHTIIREMSKEEADAYRATFEEWLAPKKLYCPSPTCSVFIPERVLPVLGSTPVTDARSSLKEMLDEVLEKLIASPSSRFFRAMMPLDQYWRSVAVVKCPMYVSTTSNGLPSRKNVLVQTIEDYANAILALPSHLGDIKVKIHIGSYDTLPDFTADIKLILTNARKYNGTDHPITRAAEEFYSEYVQQISSMTDRLLNAPPKASPIPPTMFPCPKCHIAICFKCKQIEHSTSPCDNSAELEEIAMLKKFNYKRCPRCRNAVKKMYGCSHMACRCGAHWCWRCEQSTEECDGGCVDDPDVSDDEDDEDEDEDEEIERLEREEFEAELARQRDRRVRDRDVEHAAEMAATGSNALPPPEAGLAVGATVDILPADNPAVPFTPMTTETVAETTITRARIEDVATRFVEGLAEARGTVPDAAASAADPPQIGDATGQPLDPTTTSATLSPPPSAPAPTGESPLTFTASQLLSTQTTDLTPLTLDSATPASVATRIVNLDAGGGRRWHGGAGGLRRRTRRRRPPASLVLLPQLRSLQTLHRRVRPRRPVTNGVQPLLRTS